MINYEHTHDVRQVEPMIPHFVLHVGTEKLRLEFARQLVITMTNSPNTVNVIQAWSYMETVEKELLGVIIGTNSVTQPYILIPQAWSHPGNSFEIMDELFGRLVMWAASMGKTSVRAETTRNVESMFHRFGLTEIAKVIERKITPEESSAWAASLTKTLMSTLTPC